eukprot:GHVN01090928.1.p1 GENE.GHVN01090928.1~~GHVN01090928.1.p1  ORF type:complete len:314 (+),score=37.25 GHVN01090928.1:80-1021(+)
MGDCVEDELISHIKLTRASLDELDGAEETEHVVEERLTLLEVLHSLEEALKGLKPQSCGASGDIFAPPPLEAVPSGAPDDIFAPPSVVSSSASGRCRPFTKKAISSTELDVDTFCEILARFPHGVGRIVGRVEKILPHNYIVSHASPWALNYVPCRFIKTPEECRFADRCRFHHGFTVPRDKVEPFQWRAQTNIVKGDTVMAKMPSDLWRAVSVISVEGEGPNFRVRVVNQHSLRQDALTLTSNEVLPILDEEAIPPSVLEKKDDVESQEVMVETECPHERVLSAEAPKGGFGEWTKYSKGISRKPVSFQEFF